MREEWGGGGGGGGERDLQSNGRPSTIILYRLIIIIIIMTISSTEVFNGTLLGSQKQHPCPMHWDGLIIVRNFHWHMARLQ